MASKRTKAGLQSEINTRITSGVPEGITGAIHNLLLQDFTESLLFNNGDNVIGGNGVGFSGTYSQDSGVEVHIDIDPTIEQTVTAGYVALNINITETTVGSGINTALRVQKGGTDKLSISSDGDINMDGDIVLTSSAADVFITFTESDSAISFTIGIDDDDSNNFKLSRSTALGTSDVIEFSDQVATFSVKPFLTYAGQGDAGENNSMDIIIDPGTNDLTTLIRNSSASITSNILRFVGDNCDYQFIHFDTDGTENVAIGVDNGGIFNICNNGDLAGTYVFRLDMGEDHSLTMDNGLSYMVNSTSNRNFTIHNEGTGDIALHWKITGQIYSSGIDNSDSDQWKLSVGSTLATNVVIQIDTSNNLICPSMPTSSAGLPSGALYSNSGVITIV